jgi:TP901 family phage tail tape measure protein
MPIITQKLGFDAGGATRSLGNLTKKLRETTQELKDFQAQSAKGTGKIDSALKKTTKAADGFLVSWKTIARVIGTQFVVRGLAAVLSQISEGVQRARDLSRAIEEIQTISGRGMGSGQLAADILAISDSIGKTGQDVAEAFYQTLSNQVVEVGQAFEFTSQAAKLATITVSETKDAVNALSSVMNSYSFEASRAEHVAGTLFKTVELGRLRLSEIANVIGRVTPLTAAMGVSWEETAASIAVMTRQGVKADTAITQLRAVMTKIIRPTQEMRDIFHAWGVRDGKEAVETFGGLNGVLKKLAEETGHSSEAMADLLRRVRTIVAQLSLMKDGGEALADTLEKIKGASNELTEQWDLFTQSDAHRLTVEVNKFDNALNRVGLESMPHLVATMGVLNKFMGDVVFQARALSGEFDEAGVNAELMKHVAIGAGVAIRKRAKDFDEEQRKRYDGLAEAAGRYYVGVQLEENKLAAIRDTGISAATTAVKAQGKNIVDFYKKAAKNLEDFVDGINGVIKDNTEAIADIQRELNQDALDAELDKWDSSYKKVFILEKALQAQRLKARDAFGDLGVSEESRDRALLENEIALDLADQTISLAEEAGHQTTILKAEGERQGLLINRQGIYKRHTQLLEDHKGKIGETNKLVQEGATDLEALIKERNNLLESGALQDKNEARRKKAFAVLASLNNKIDDIFTDATRHDEFLQSLGLDTALDEITSTLTEALNASTKDWQVEVAEMHAAFEDEVIFLNVVVDPEGVRQAAVDALELKPKGSEGIAGFARATDKAIIANAKEYETIQESIDKTQTDINNKLKLTNQALAKGAADIVQVRDQYARVIKPAATVQNILSKWTGGLIASVDATLVLNHRMLNVQGTAAKLNTSFQAAADALRSGEVLTDGQLVSLEEQLNLAHRQEQINEERTKVYRDQLKLLQGANDSAKERAAFDAKLPEQDVVDATIAARDALIEQKDAGLSVAEAADLTRQNIDAAKEATVEVETATKKGTVAQTAQTTAAGGTTTAVAAIGTASAANVTIINGVAVAFDNVTRAANGAARASAGVVQNPFAGQFHGGPMNRFFADGGPITRGQDKILTALSSGENVTNSKNSARFASELNAINQGSPPVFREQGGPVTTVGDVNITVNGGDSSQQTVREIGRLLRRDIQRGITKL